jgi:hypothetical protein
MKYTFSKIRQQIAIFALVTRIHPTIPLDSRITNIARAPCGWIVLKMADEEDKFVCQCFFTHNIFLEEYKAHVIFENEKQFFSKYRKVI